jgi:hypothetical protein
MIMKSVIVVGLLAFSYSYTYSQGDAAKKRKSLYSYPLQSNRLAIC